MTRTIRTADELLALKARQRRRGLRRVVLALPGDPARRDRAERAINRGLRACGCETAAALLACGIGVVALLAVLGLISLGWWVLVALCALALVGKIAGLAFAEWRLRAAIDAQLR
jgi:hypothetical protein